MEREFRKARDQLRITGIGTLMLGLWTPVKMLLYNLMAPNYVRELFDVAPGDTFKMAVVLLAWGILALLAGGLRIGLWRRTKRECRESAGVFYLVVAGGLTLVSSSAVLYNLSVLLGREASIAADHADILSSMILDVTSAANLIALIVYSVRVKKLRKALSKEVRPDAD